MDNKTLVLLALTFAEAFLPLVFTSRSSSSRETDISKIVKEVIELRREIERELASLRTGSMVFNITIPQPSLESEEKHEEIEKKAFTGPLMPGQTPENACLECLYRHHLKAIGLLEEGERFSLPKGEITPEARHRIELALKEIVTSEEDLGTRVSDPELAKMLEEIAKKQREWRKWLWSQNLLTTEKRIEKLREAIEKLKEIHSLIKKATEYYTTKHGRCPYCEQLASEVAEKSGINVEEAREIIYGLAGEDKEKITKSLTRLKELGLYEHVMKRAEEMLTEMRG